jgi:tetratricopeptide (TPR) repeat protein
MGYDDQPRLDPFLRLAEMPAATLQIRRSELPLRKPEAWLLPGCDPSLWLDEVCRWGVPLERIRLYPLPVSSADRRPLAVLATGLLASTDKNHTSRVSARAIPYGLIAERLYVPVDAAVHPLVSESEWSKLLGDDLVSVWHPAIGLVRFDADEALRVADLLAAPQRLTIGWGSAVAGVRAAKRLNSVEPESQLTLEQIFDEERGDIASEPPTLDRLPPAPGEKRGWFRRMFKPDDTSASSPASKKSGLGERLKAALARMALKFAANRPQTSDRRTWVNSVEDWARGALQKLNLPNPFARMREIQRLLHLLETDPAQGLKHAIPFGGNEAHRGRGAAGNELGTRDIDFNLNRLGGGGPADFWDLPDQYRLQLMQKYRDLAAREVAAGRHRRAAFIHAELLGDINSAAAVLTVGRHFREAAVLYRDRLKNPLQAARCLEQGGLLQEAAHLYEEQKRFDEAGLIYRRLQEEEDAVRCFEIEIEACRQKSDYVRGAQLVEQRLNLPLRALGFLSEKWWRTENARVQGTLSAYFDIAGRHGQADFADQALRNVRGQSDLRALLQPVARVLAAQAVGYPEEKVRHEALDTLRSVAAKYLPDLGLDETRQLTAALTSAVQGDRLLVRDGERFVRGAEEAIKAREESRRLAQAQAAAANQRRLPGPPALTRPRAAIRLDHPRTTTLKSNVEWVTAAAAGNTFYVAGYVGDMLVVHRGYWGEPLDPLQRVVWKLGPRVTTLEPYLSLAPHPRDVQPLAVHVAFHAPLMDRSFPPTDRQPNPLPAGGPSWVKRYTNAIARDAGGTIWEATWQRDHYLVQSYDLEGVPQTSSTTDALEAINESQELRGFHAGQKYRYLAFQRGLVVMTTDGNQTAEFRDEILSMAGSPPHTRPRVALTHADGGSVVWGPRIDFQIRPFAQGLVKPSACFTTSGWLVAASEHAVSVSSASNLTVTESLRTAVRWGTPFAVLPTASPNEFAVFSQNPGGLDVTTCRIIPA